MDDFAIGVVSSSGGPGHMLPQPINASGAYPSFSPDGKHVVFARAMLTAGIASAPSLMIQSVKAGRARPLNIQAGRPVWSPNGRWIVFQYRSTQPGLSRTRLARNRSPLGHDGTVFAQARGSLNVLEKTTFDMPAKASVPGSFSAASPAMTRYVVAPISTVKSASGYSPNHSRYSGPSNPTSARPAVGSRVAIERRDEVNEEFRHRGPLFLGLHRADPATATTDVVEDR